MNIYVGNIDSEVTENQLRDLFARFGEVGKVTISRDRHGISRGFGFVEMPAEDEGTSAIEGLSRTLFHDRTLDISQSLPPSGKGGRGKPKYRPTRFRR